MANNPAFQFYAQDFLVSTMHLTNEETGAYIKLLSYQWINGKIPKKRLPFIVGLGFEEIWKNIKDKFSEEKTGEIFNNRLEEIRDQKMRYLKTQSENGKRGGRPKKTEAKSKPNESQNKPNPFLKQKPIKSQLKTKQKVIEVEVEVKVKEDKKRGCRGKKNPELEKCYQGCLENFPENLRPKSEEQVAEWYETLVELEELDGVSFKDIVRIAKKARGDKFWGNHLSSIHKLLEEDKNGLLYIFRYDQILEKKEPYFDMNI